MTRARPRRKPGSIASPTMLSTEVLRRSLTVAAGIEIVSFLPHEPASEMDTVCGIAVAVIGQGSG